MHARPGWPGTRSRRAALFTNRAAQIRVFRDFNVLQGDIQEATRDFLQLFEQTSTFARRAAMFATTWNLFTPWLRLQHLGDAYASVIEAGSSHTTKQHVLRRLCELTTL